MFQFPRLASATYGFSCRWFRIPGTGFPHSDISGSKLARSYPELIAVCHVLHRLSVPRHPPHALCSLTEHVSRELSRQPLSSSRYAARPSCRNTSLYANPMLATLTRNIQLSKNNVSLVLRELICSLYWRHQPQSPPLYPARKPLVEMTGIEPAPSALQERRSPN